MVSQHGIDRRRLRHRPVGRRRDDRSDARNYPEVFAAGGIIAGLPYRAATNVQEAFDGMFQCAPRPARAWGDLVRAASASRAVAARLGVAWRRRCHDQARERRRDHQAMERRARPRCGPDPQRNGRRLSPQVWRNLAGEDVIRSYTITSMAHGTPLATSGRTTAAGSPAPSCSMWGFRPPTTSRNSSASPATSAPQRCGIATLPRSCRAISARRSGRHSAQEQATARARCRSTWALSSDRRCEPPD